MNDDELRSAFQDLLHDLPADRALPHATARRVARRRGLKLGAGSLGGVGAVAVAAALVLGLVSPSQDRLVVPAEQPTPTVTPTPSPAATPSAEPSAALRVILRPDGLGFTDGGSSTSALPFGADAVTVRTAVDRALLEGSEIPTPDCGPGSSTVQHENLFLLLQDGDFVGWVTGSPGLTTGDGLAVGTTLVELREALPGVVVTQGTLGPEWSTVEGGLAGFLDGTDDSSIVNRMAAGVRCLFR